MRNIALTACVLFAFAACDNNSKYDLNEAKNSYMEQTLPQVKKIRDQVVFQIKICSENIDKLEKLKYSFQKQESKALVQTKIDQIVNQRKTLAEHINKIDTEVEKGLALQAFNSIDGGGIRHNELKEITQEAQKSVSSAQNINNSIAKEYGVSTNDVSSNKNELPPKAIPIDLPVPKAEIIVPKQTNIQQLQREQYPIVEENSIKTTKKLNQQKILSLKQQLNKLNESRLMFEEQLLDTQRRDDIVGFRITQHQLKMIVNKIFDIESEIHAQQ